MTLPQDFIGVDIAKDWIDVFHLATGRRERIAMTGPALGRFARSAHGALVVFEASGGYERSLAEALVRAGVDHARINPRQAREFARASGRLAKTDRVDAEGLAAMGRALELAPTPVPDASRTRLAALVARRDDLVAMIQSEKNRARQTGDRWTAREIDRLIKVLEKHRATVEAEIEALVAADAELAAQSRRLRAVPGIGPAISAVLIARLPELGQLDRRAIASLAGLAPHADDSGLRRGKRRIWGGRADLRRALYIAGFIASRYDPTIKEFRHRLEAAGKPVKVAITACARKLLTILNAMVRDQTDYRRA